VIMPPLEEADHRRSRAQAAFWNPTGLSQPEVGSRVSKPTVRTEGEVDD
jgi:hypothetical protein